MPSDTSMNRHVPFGLWKWRIRFLPTVHLVGAEKQDFQNLPGISRHSASQAGKQLWLHCWTARHPKGPAEHAQITYTAHSWPSPTPSMPAVTAYASYNKCIFFPFFSGNSRKTFWTPATAQRHNFYKKNVINLHNKTDEWLKIQVL